MKITVFTPTFQRANTIHRVYESLLVQDNKNFEWIIIDDGSTDNTKEIVQQWKEKGEIEIRYFIQKNRGKFLTLIEGIKIAKGELFLIADSDDRFVPETLSFFAETFSNITPAQKLEIAGISCLVKDSHTGEIVGN